MSTQVQQKSGGIGFCSLLAVLFIGLKLTGYIDWSWLWVLAPLWLPVAFVLTIFLVFGLIWAVGSKRSARRW